MFGYRIVLAQNTISLCFLLTKNSNVCQESIVLLASSSNNKASGAMEWGGAVRIFFIAYETTMDADGSSNRFKTGKQNTDFTRVVFV